MGELVDTAYQRAYERYASELFRFALAWTNEWSSAEDLTQEAYLRLWRHCASIDWDRPILAWLVVTVRHLANNRFRTFRRRLTPIRSEVHSDEGVRDRWIDVRQALEKLTPLERCALLLTSVEGWSYKEVADALNTTDGALRAAVSRARDKLETA